MTLNEPPYVLTAMLLDEHEWRFEESNGMSEATLEFDRILESTAGEDYVDALRNFVHRHPNHIDGLHHFASCLNMSGAWLEGYAFSQTAVAVGVRAFPPEFKIGRDRLPTGYLSNRPFLRAAQGLMLAQYCAGLAEDAIDTGRMCLDLDPGDRMGARLSIPIYLLEQGRDRQALELFEHKDFVGSFHGVGYLHALALIKLKREQNAASVLADCLKHYPQVARYLLNKRLPAPPPDGSFGVISGGECEAWLHVQDFGELWQRDPEAMKILRKHAKPVAAAGWKRYWDSSK